MDMTEHGRHQEILRISRKKLESFFDPDGDLSRAEEFFQRVSVNRLDMSEQKCIYLTTIDRTEHTRDKFALQVMEKTGTFVRWPSRIKIGARSKRDPQIKIMGEQDAVLNAREKILDVFECRMNRISLKMEVSYTDHSHIIGRKGESIKSVMDSTGCHIHFPDSNRFSTTEKCNQVSIAGEPQAAELARARVRRLTPVIFSFDFICICDSDISQYPIMNEIQRSYNVQVFLRTRGRNMITVQVKGNQWELPAVRDAALTLMLHLCQGQVPVHMTLEISPQHHALVLGPNLANVRMIMQRTNTQIIWPDLQDPNLPSLKRSTFTISGAITNVYMARELLIGSIPLILMCDMPANVSLNVITVQEVMAKLDVMVYERPKTRLPGHRTLVIKALERNAGSVYEARRLLLNLQDGIVQAEIPQTYIMPGAPPLLGLEKPRGAMSGCSPFLRAVAPVVHPLLFTREVTTPYMNPPTRCIIGATGCWGGGGGGGGSSGSGSEQGGFSLGSSIPSSTPPSSSSSSISLSQPHSHSQSLESIHESNEMLDLKAPGCERSALVRGASASSPGDYERKQLLANRAMQEPVQRDVPRIPTSTWSGLGFSRSANIPSASVSSTSPPRSQPQPDPAWPGDSGGGGGDAVFRDPPGVDEDRLGLRRKLDFLITPSRLSASNHMDAVNVHLSPISQHDSLPELLAKLGLGKFADLLEKQDVDVGTFRTMTEEDLQKLGVRTFGARRKMLLAIQGIQIYAPGNLEASRAEQGFSSSRAFLRTSFLVHFLYRIRDLVRDWIILASHLSATRIFYRLYKCLADYQIDIPSA
ncbi:unnamed protein product [Darwinula stevensoni]|uniref:SAM domain-containing protein n=1 Tax=Darwinula stevensoni TaxID=69355 RepID=A0A7R8X801_9CRUS|nr:unnamed protein product [Darwinula stevensoni]CAG0882875.1 unnamed protein product [Darwinula stevensoni]